MSNTFKLRPTYFSRVGENVSRGGFSPPVYGAAGNPSCTVTSVECLIANFPSDSRLLTFSYFRQHFQVTIPCCSPITDQIYVRIVMRMSTAPRQNGYPAPYQVHFAILWYSEIIVSLASRCHPTMCEKQLCVTSNKLLWNYTHETADTPANHNPMKIYCEIHNIDIFIYAYRTKKSGKATKFCPKKCVHAQKVHKKYFYLLWVMQTHI